MARRPRIELAGFHHIFNQGVARSRIYLTSNDKEKFLELLCRACKVYHVTLHDYVLLDDSYHLFVQTSRKNLSLFVRQINSNYAVYFNQKYKRNGHLWQGRFKSWFIEDDHEIQRVFKYIEHQPLELGRASHIGEYDFSLIAAIFNQNVPQCAKKSRLKEDLESLGKLDHQAFMLSEDDKEQIAKQQARKVDYSGNAYIEQQNKNLRDYFKKIQSKAKRNEAVLEALDDGYTQAALAYHLKLSTSTISKIVTASKSSL